MSPDRQDALVGKSSRQDNNGEETLFSSLFTPNDPLHGRLEGERNKT